MAAVHLAIFLHPSIHVSHVRPIRFDWRVLPWIVHLFAFVHFTPTPSQGLLHHFQRHLRGQRGLLLCCSFLRFSVPAVAQALSICRHFWPTWRNTAWLHNCHVRRLLALLHFAQR